MLDRRRFGFKRRLMGKSNSSMIEYSRVKLKDKCPEVTKDDIVDKKKIRFKQDDKRIIVDEVLKKIREMEGIE